MKDCRIWMAVHNTVTLRSAWSNPSGSEQSMLLMHFSLFHATGALPTTFTWEFWAIQCLHT